MTTARTTEIEELDHPACWELLRAGEVGRLAVAIAGHPDIFPVNYVVDHGSIVFRTEAGTKLAAAVLGTGVAFEIDGRDDATGTAWSVVAKGVAHEVVQLHDYVDALDLPLHPWAGGSKSRFVRILPDVLTGRRFTVVADAALDEA
jgi:nitroimidazol reductase NimA-like FMN-containing flavoprotein (pyridoxamine 5'-phosphate oxidase superfamily)